MARIIIDRTHAEHVAPQRGFWNAAIPEGDGTPAVALSVCETPGALWCNDAFDTYELECNAGDIVAHIVGYLRWTPEQLAQIVRNHCAADPLLFGEGYATAETIEAAWHLEDNGE